MIIYFFTKTTSFQELLVVLPEEEKRRRAEEAERILGPERCKQIDKEIAEWKKQNKKLKGEA